MIELNDSRRWLTKRWQTLSAAQRVAFLLLPLLLILSLVVTLKQISSDAVDEPAPIPIAPVVAESIDERVSKHTASVMTLQRWLLSGRNTQQQAGIALTMLEQLQALSKSPFDELAWQNYSAELDELEYAVAENIISTPEAIALVEALRIDYFELRERASGTNLADAQNVDAVAEQALEIDQGADVSHWLYALLPLLLLSLATVAWLFYSLNQTAKPTDASAMRSVDSRANQNAILQLLDEMEPLADGDLRVKATVTEAMTGALADAFNQAVTELRWLVGAINGSAAQVTESVSNTRESASNLAQASTVQAREIHRSSNYLNVMSDTMAQLSAHAAESSRIAVDSVKQAQVGSVAVEASVKGLANIREHAQMTSRLMERLVESSDAIKKHVSEIQRVAKHTDLLALNTTIRAAATTGLEQTDDLSRLSAEVTQLATTLRLATQEISNLAGIIQQDAALTLRSVRKTKHELDSGHQKTIQASHSLRAIESVSHELQNQINDIASKTLRQAGVVKQLSANMGVINGITADSAVGLQEAANELEDLQLMANALSKSVSRFTLPEAANANGALRRAQVAVSANQHSEGRAPARSATPVQRAD